MFITWAKTKPQNQVGVATNIAKFWRNFIPVHRLGHFFMTIIKSVRFEFVFHISDQNIFFCLIADHKSEEHASSSSKQDLNAIM